MKKYSLILTTLLLMSAGVANAGLVTFDFQGGCSSSCGLDGPNGNTRVFSEGGVELSVNAFAEDGNSNTTAFLGHFGSGLGITNRNEGNGSGSRHVVDNSGTFEWARFMFDQDVIVESVLLRVFDGNEADISYLVGAFNSNFGSWSTQEGNRNDPPGGNAALLTLNNDASSNFFRLAAEYGENNDDFKIAAITVRTPMIDVAEPLPLGLLGLGLLALAVTRRKQQ